VVIAAIALGWNIYRDIFSKARIKVSASRVMIHRAGMNPTGPYLSLDVTNFGPGSVKIELIVYRDTPSWRRPFSRAGGMIVHDYENPLSATLPNRLQDPGDRLNLLLSWSNQDANCIFMHPFYRLGVRDSFGRNLWVPQNEIRLLKNKFAKEFRH
jgi:hypothetical protein